MCEVRRLWFVSFAAFKKLFHCVTVDFWRREEIRKKSLLHFLPNSQNIAFYSVSVSLITRYSACVFMPAVIFKRNLDSSSHSFFGFSA